MINAFQETMKTILHWKMLTSTIKMFAYESFFKKMQS